MTPVPRRPPPPPAAGPRPVLVEYACRACGHWLFTSDATVGRVTALCRNRRCRLRQTVYLGGRRPVAEVLAAWAEGIRS